MGGTSRRDVFWAGGLLLFFMGALGVGFPAATATAFYRLDLAGSSVTLVGLGSLILGAALWSFAEQFSMESFERAFSYTYGAVLLHSLVVSGSAVHESLGLFSDLLNSFFLWCVWQNWSGPAVLYCKPVLPAALYRNAKILVDATSPK